ncbi:uncharacterized protein DNG_10504 [Cephalotrichum gorgonifer]|uniref:Uncharacterized protein n=1 Tax=Cephalotrichum gorgonifer TaxID=2041049 RepID=A0AAE8N8G6_9PEZI|nr:uncharacterized protein DNG_10504 [Cephalotrichum gorgonifer]
MTSIEPPKGIIKKNRITGSP